MKKVGVIFALILAIGFTLAMSSTNYATSVESDSGGGVLNSINYYTNVIVGTITGMVASTNYINDIGFFSGAGSSIAESLVPIVSFVFPTPDDGNITHNLNVEINATITEENLGSVNFTWDEIDYSMYDENLVLMYNFDNISALGENDSFVKDVSLYENDGNITNVTEKVTGRYGKGIYMDGYDYISIDSNLSVNGAMTISFWFNSTSKAVNDYFFDSRNGGNVWFIRDYTGAGLCELESGDICYDGRAMLNDSDWDTNTWYHITVTDNATESRIYLNGELKTIGVGEAVVATVDAVIGGRYTYANRMANMTFDEFRIWNRTLGADEIRQQYYSNLNKYDTDKWLLYVNQSFDEPLWNETHNYSVSVQDYSSNVGSAGPRDLIVMGKPYLINANTSSDVYGASQNPEFNSLWNNSDGILFLLSEDKKFENCNYANQSGCLANSSLDLTSPTVASSDPLSESTKWYAKVCDGYKCSTREKEISWSMDTNLSDSNVSWYGSAVTDWAGFSTTTVGDVNGDGYDDIVFGAPQNDDGGADAGKIYLVFGRPSGWSGNFNLSDDSNFNASFIGEAAGDKAGWVSSGVGDVNGDGLDDFITSSYLNDEGGSNAGQVYLIFGRESGWAMGGNLSDSVDASWVGNTGNNLGIRLSSTAGDVNNDGFDDFLINSGYGVHLIFGNSTGFQNNIDIADVDVSFTDVSRLGWSMSTAGDVNGDGYDDILIGDDIDTSERGMVYLVFGKTTGWSADMNITSIANASWYGRKTSARFGGLASAVGDVNGDGYDDILASELDSTNSYIIFGKTTGWSTNVNVTLVASASFSTEGSDDFGGLTIYRRVNGDVNGDGYDDILIGTRYNDEGGSNAGQVYLIYGKSDGWLTGMSLSDANASWIGETTNDASGWATSLSGDVNGDGYDDILIGSSQYNTNGAGGKVDLILSSSSDTRQTAGVVTIDSTAPEINVISPENNSVYSGSTVWFNATANELTSGWVVNYNGTNYTLSDINSSLEISGDGYYNLLLYANDSYGNWGINDSVWFYIDYEAPEIEFVLPTPDNATISYNESIGINLTISDFSSIRNITYVFDSEEYYWSGDGSFDDPYNFTTTEYNVTCTDYIDWFNIADDGYYVVSPNGSFSKKIYCNQSFDSGGWMLLDNFVSANLGDVDPYLAALSESNIRNSSGNLTTAGWDYSLTDYDFSGYPIINGYLQLFESGAPYGYISKTLPSYADEVYVKWGNWYSGTADLLIGGGSVQALGASAGASTYQGSYNPSDVIRFEENGIFWVGEIWVRASNKTSSPDLERINSTYWKVDIEKGYLGFDNYTYYATACDKGGSCNSTGARLFTRDDQVAPIFEFVPNTPSNGSSTVNLTSEINVSISELGFSGLNFTWDEVDYPMYDDDLVLMYNFDNLSVLGENDTVVKDMSIYGNDGVVNGSNWTSSGKYNGGYNFDGVDDYILVADDGTGKFDYQNFSIEAWFKSDSDPDDLAQPIWSYDYISHSNPYYAQHLRIGGTSSNEDEVAFCWNNGVSSNCLYANNSLSGVQYDWHHVVGTFTSGEQKIYLDGVEVANNNSLDTISYYDQEVWVGKANFAGTFNGTIDEVRFWNRSLSASEVELHYESNLNKYDFDKWQLFVNKSYERPLADTTYTYSVSGEDNFGQSNSSEIRYLNVLALWLNISLDKLYYDLFDNVTFSGDWAGLDEVKLMISDDKDFVNCNYTNQSGCYANSSLDSSTPTISIHENATDSTKYFGRICDSSYCSTLEKTYNWSNDVNASDASISFYGQSSNEYSGYSISYIGDFNGDGYDDIAIGAYGANEFGTGTGAVYVIYGEELPFGSINLSEYDSLIYGESPNDAVGYSVSNAGDFNGDGLGDIVIGAYSRDEEGSDVGKAYVVFGNSEFPASMNLSDANVSWYGEDDDGRFGYDISGVGDVNGDGLDDLLVGAYLGSEGGMSYNGEVYLMFGSQSGFAHDVNITGISNASWYGESLNSFGKYFSGVGDVNNDGYDDMLIGAYNDGQGGSNAGKVYLVLGSPSGWSNNVNITTVSNASWYGEKLNTRLGGEISGAGDVNNDGYDDMLISGYHYNSETGKVYLVLGSPSGWSNNVNITTVSNASWHGESSYGDFGAASSMSGDVNNDGYDDILIGAFGYEGGGNNIGKAYLVLGSPSGWSNNVNITTVSNASWYGEDNNYFFGRSVSLFGDFNGDGYDDVAIGASGADSFMGRTYVILSKFLENDWSASGVVSVDNVAPDTPTPWIYSNDGMNYSTSDLICSFDVVDNMASELNATVRWYKDGILNQTVNYNGNYANGIQVNATLLSGDTTKGQNWSCSVQVIQNEYLKSIWGNSSNLTIISQPLWLNVSLDKVVYNLFDNVTFNGSWIGDENIRLLISNNSDFMNCTYTDQSGCYANGSLTGSTPTFSVHENATESTKYFARVCDFADCSSLEKTYNWSNNADLLDASVILYGETNYDYSSDSASISGDVNGDGYDDILVGAYLNDDYGTDSGKAYLMFGNVADGYVDDLGESDVIFYGEEDDSEAGRTVVIIEDVNGDGYDEVLISAHSYGGGRGKVYLFFGKPSNQWDPVLNLSNADASWYGNNTGDILGYAMAGAGDVNGDGYNDILISSQAYNSNRGKTYLIFGKASGWSPDVDISAVSNASFLGESGADYAGHSLSGAGDVNGDGFDDILIGAYLSDQGGGSSAGEIYLILGSSNGWINDFSLSNANASWFGESTYDRAGQSVAILEDVNGDGFDDILTGARNNEGGGGTTFAGQTYMIFGKASGWSTNLNLSSANASWYGEGSSDTSGEVIASVGDINRDGFGDFAISAYYNDEIGTNAGQVYLIFGRENNWSMYVNLSDINNSFIGDGVTGGDVISAGDVNGDGYNDIAIDHLGYYAGSGAGELAIVYSKFNETWSRSGVVSVDNVAPTVSSVILNSSGNYNYTNEDLVCSFVVNDDMSNNLNATVRWYKDGALDSISYYNNSYSNGAQVDAVLLSGNTTKHDDWSCSVQVIQSSLLKSDWVNSSNLTIVNHVPVVTLIGPENGNSTSDRTPTFNWSVLDYDGDSFFYTINITPYYGANPSSLDVRVDGGIDEYSYTPSSDLKLLYDNGYHYEWKVIANDGEVTGNWSETWTVNITAEVGILLLNDEIYFGSMDTGETNTTEDPALDPFLVENNGTVVINVSMNASQLWNTRPENSSDYQFKADEYSLETGSFNLVDSIMNWFNMPLTGYVVGVSELNYTDATDTAEIDINLTVPNGEDPGQKDSTIVFLAELAE